MNLKRVTITGADDSVDPMDLVKLSEEFPFVEWGILFGRGQGTSRFPSTEWLYRLATVFPKSMKLSAHLCGRWVRDFVLNSNFSWSREYRSFSSIFQRVQLNFHSQYHRQDINFPFLLEEMARGWSFILQRDGVNDEAARILSYRGLCVPLFDTSGGAGVLPGQWPAAWPKVYCGYAGGLGPENILEQLEKIGSAAGNQPFWVDMERRVRSEDDSQFDLEKVRSVLSQVAEFVKAE